jgi:hypothetical protein
MYLRQSADGPGGDNLSFSVPEVRDLRNGAPSFGGIAEYSPWTMIHQRDDGADSPYGLSGSVWTKDTTAALDVARRVRTGTFGINGMGMDFGGPFGGFKCSGIGRELGPEGLAGYLESKNISLNGGAAIGS